jgi:hypothetical protein
MLQNGDGMKEKCGAAHVTIPSNYLEIGFSLKQLSRNKNANQGTMKMALTRLEDFITMIIQFFSRLLDGMQK